MNNDTTPRKGSKAQLYRQIATQIEALVDGVSNHVGALANVSAALKEAFGYYLWVGFYVVRDNYLELGPFQGPVACYSIGRGKGVCGKAWEEKRTIIVPDVSLFPGHIACSLKSRSEIVVPIMRGDEVVGVIDVDSSALEAFDYDDRMGLEAIARLVDKLI